MCLTTACVAQNYNGIKLDLSANKAVNKKYNFLGGSVSYVSRILCIPYFGTKTFGHHSPMLPLLSGITCLVKLGAFSEPLHLIPLWRPICSKQPTTACRLALLSNLFSKYFGQLLCCEFMRAPMHVCNVVCDLNCLWSLLFSFYTCGINMGVHSWVLNTMPSSVFMLEVCALFIFHYYYYICF